MSPWKIYLLLLFGLCLYVSALGTLNLDLLSECIQWSTKIEQDNNGDY